MKRSLPDEKSVEVENNDDSQCYRTF